MAALFSAGRFAELERQSRAVLSTLPTSAGAWQLLGLAQVRQGKDALEALQASVRCAPQNAAAVLNLGNELARQGRLPEAAEHYACALQLQPEFPEAYHNLADLHLEMGRLDAAVQASARAIAQRPEYAEAHQTLGVALLRLERYQEAAASCRQALSLRAEFPEAHNSLGNALLRMSQFDAALESFRIAIQLQPAFAEAHANLANALRALGRLDDAVASYRRALSLKTDLTAAHIDLGTALRLQRLGPQAEASVCAALALDPESSSALVVLAELRADAGRFADAEGLFQRAAAVDPDAVAAWAGQVRVRRMTEADGAWLAGALRLADSGLAPRRELVLRYALGKYFDDIGDAERAFYHYRRANQLSAACGPPHDRGHISNLVDRLIDGHDAGWLAGTRCDASTTRRPVFIVGMLRSGTTLAEQILAAHPDVWGGGELSFWGDALAALLPISRAASARGVRAGSEQLRAYGAHYLERLTRLSVGALRVVDKMPSNFFALGLIHAAMPLARVIHMRRDPIDTGLSIYFQHLEAVNSYANHLGDIAHFYREYKRLMHHWRSVMPDGTILDVPYEALVHNPAVWTRKMLEFIDVPWDPACLDFHHSTRTVVTASKWQVRQKIHAGAVKRWRRYEKYLAELTQLTDSASP